MSGKLIHYAAKLSIFLVTAALIAGVAGCGSVGPPIKPEQLIWTWRDLDNVRNDLVGTYFLAADLTTNMTDYAEVAGPTAHGGEGWWPIGLEFGQFRGRFYGWGNQICGLCIKSDRNEVGLFGYVGWPGVIDNVSVVNVTVNGMEFVGGLVGRNNGTVTNCSSGGSVEGTSRVGGLVGWNDVMGSVTNSYVTPTCNVTGNDCVGGLVGWNKGMVSYSHSSGRVTGTESVGGLVGFNEAPAVEYCYSTDTVKGMMYAKSVGGLVGWNDGKVSCSYYTGNVTGYRSVGGLVGCNYGDIVDSSYSTGDVTGTFAVGGLVGDSNVGSMVNDSYSFSRVTGNQDVGGLVGFNNGAIVGKSFSTGGVIGQDDIGGLLGRNDVGGTVSDSFWDKQTSGMNVSSRGTGKTTAEMKDLNTFYDTGTEGLQNQWDIGTDITAKTEWYIINGRTYPYLNWEKR
jgi:hypothetical protein